MKTGFDHKLYNFTADDNLKAYLSKSWQWNYVDFLKTGWKLSTFTIKYLNFIIREP
jgi:hypothetical protein